MKTGTEILKRAAFCAMAILFVINISTMANADKIDSTGLNSTTDEIQTLRMTTSRLKETQKELLEEIGRLESRIHEYESKRDSNADE